MKTLKSFLRGAAISGFLLSALTPNVLASVPDDVVGVQEALLVAGFAPAEAEFGRSIDIDGDRAVIGAAADEALSGTVYVFRKIQVTGEWVFEAKIIPPGDAVGPFDQFGQDVAIEGNRIAIGAPWAMGSGDTSGAVFTYERIGNQWGLDQELHSPSGDAFGRFGADLDLTGDFLVVGAWRDDATADDSGAAYVFRHQGGNWGHSQTLNSPFAIEDEFFGISIDAHASRVAIGAPGFPAGSSTGAIYVFDLNANTWTLDQQLTGANTEGLGQAVAIYGTHVLAGAPSNDGAGTDRGAVYYFKKGAVSYTFRQKVEGTQDGERFGTSVDLNPEDIVEPESPIRAVVGAPYFEAGITAEGRVQFMTLDPVQDWIDDESYASNTPSEFGRFGTSVAIHGRSALVGEVSWNGQIADEGSVHTFDRGATGWFTGENLTGTEHDANEQFGRSIAVEGDLAVVGMPGDDDTVENGGGAVVYERQGSFWRPVMKLNASSNAMPGALFGSDVDTDGTHIVVGAPGEDGASTDSGAAYLFTRNPQGIWKREARLVPSAPQYLSNFGASVGVSEGRVVVGAPHAGGGQADSGMVYVFGPDSGGEWGQVDRLNELGGSPNALAGSDVAIDGNFLAVSAPGIIGNSGVVLTYLRQGLEWNYNGSLQAETPASQAHFGSGLAMDGTTLAVGAYGENQDQGGVYVYERVGLAYSFVKRLAPEHDQGAEEFGRDIDIDGNVLVVGARRESANVTDGGAVYAYRRIGAVWQEGKLQAATGLDRDFFGTAVAISENTVWVGAVGSDEPSAENAGAVHVYDIQPASQIQAIGLGDGSWGDCPCGNESAPGSGEGCTNSTGSGARLAYEGSTDINANDLNLHVSGMQPGVFTQLFSGQLFLDAVPFGNGLRFVGGPLKRFPLQLSSPTGEASWDDLHATGGWSAGDLRYFQVFYRDVSGPCGGSANMSNALQATFVAN